MTTPEQRARQNIDKLLRAAGWVVQDRRDLNLGAGPGVAVREFALSTGPVDYLLFVQRKAIGVVEAKPEGVTLSGVEAQSARYSSGLGASPPHWHTPRRTELKGGEVVISLVGAIGRTAVVPESLAGANTARAVGVIPLTPIVSPHWVEIWFRNPSKVADMTGKAHEVARKTLNLEDVRAADVAVPPLPNNTASSPRSSGGCRWRRRSMASSRPACVAPNGCGSRY
jgi:hypothetical protein